METSLQSVTEKLEEYRGMLEKVQKALKKNSESVQDDDIKEQREKDLLKLQGDITKVINYNEDLLKISRDKIESYFSAVKLKVSDTGRKCNLYYESDEKWYPGEINSVDIEEQTAEVTFLGFRERYRIPATYVQLLIPPKLSDIHEGQDVEVLLDDGKWHYSSIEAIEDDKITVKLARWGHKHITSLDSLRLVSEANKPLIEKEIFSIPDKFKILPNDPESVRLKKKKKIKALKKAWRSNQIEKETKLYTSSWKSFQQKATAKKTSIFKSPENLTGKVGVANSGVLTKIAPIKEDSD